MITMNRFILLLALLLPSSTKASCNPSDCIEGNCIDNTCKCNPGFLGDDCSIPFVTCEDGDRSCFNGSECRRNNERDEVTKKYKYHCDCSKAFVVSSFAGEQCEYSATTICERNGGNGEKSFCVNHGNCVEKVNSGNPHQGCTCVGEFEGLHCQYLEGKAPPEELAAVAALSQSRSKSNNISGIALAFMIFIPMVVVALFAHMIWKKKSPKGTEDPTLAAAAVSELEIQSPRGGAAVEDVEII